MMVANISRRHLPLFGTCLFSMILACGAGSEPPPNGTLDSCPDVTASVNFRNVLSKHGPGSYLLRVQDASLGQEDCTLAIRAEQAGSVGGTCSLSGTLVAASSQGCTATATEDARGGNCTEGKPDVLIYSQHVELNRITFALEKDGDQVAAGEVPIVYTCSNEQCSCRGAVVDI